MRRSAGRIAPRGLGSRGGYSSPRDIGRGYGSRGVFGSSRRFYRPYYSFRPRVSLGFGLWVGYPVAYPRYYDYDYDYPAYGYPYADAYAYPPPAYSTYGAYPPAEYDSYAAPSNGGYPPPSYGGYQAPSNGAYPPPASYPNQPQASVGVQQPEQTASGVSFEITPATAQIFVDGALVGTASMFDPSSQPLPLTPGRHHVEVRAPGYQTMEFDAEVSPGQVIPYQGAMQRGR